VKINPLANTQKIVEK